MSRPHLTVPGRVTASAVRDDQDVKQVQFCRERMGYISILTQLLRVRVEL